MSPALPAIERGPPGGEPVVLLHGFGGSALTWTRVQDALPEARTIAFDLPGHGAALDHPDAERTVVARDAVIAEIDRRGLRSVHLAGHSRGGAIACLVAIKVPERIASLTLAAPGGFDPQIEADGLATFAQARDEDELREALGRLYAPRRPSRRVIAEMVEQRRDPRVAETLILIREGMGTADGTQHTLDLARIEAASHPVTVVWGEADAVLPAAQATAISRAETIVLPGVGHMLPDEVPATVAAAIRSHFRTD